MQLIKLTQFQRIVSTASPLNEKPIYVNPALIATVEVVGMNRTTYWPEASTQVTNHECTRIMFPAMSSEDDMAICVTEPLDIVLKIIGEIE